MQVRTILEKDLNKQNAYQCIFVKQGFFWDSKNKKHKTVLIKNVTDLKTGELITDHVWLPLTDSLKKAGLCFGDTLQFMATAKRYTKMAQGQIISDFAFKNPEKIRNLSRGSKPLSSTLFCSQNTAGLN